MTMTEAASHSPPAPTASATTDVSHGWGSDHNPLDRPGVPHETQPPEPLASAHWLVPDQQRAETEPLVGQGLKLTPVFSSALPARGVSGALRRIAYRIPDYRAKRWLLLMVADRVDVLEHRKGRLLGALAVVSLLGLGAFTWRRVARG